MKLIDQETRRKSPTRSGGFPAGFLADQERVSGETRRKNRGGIKVTTQGAFYINLFYIYIPPIFFNKKYIRKQRSGADENPPKMFPAGFGRFSGNALQMLNKTRRSFRQVSEVTA